jgi:hypothetical protein
LVITGSGFFKETGGLHWKQRDSLAVDLVLKGHIPSFLKQMIPVHISAISSTTGKKISAIMYVSRDYLSIGNDDDWARVPLTPMAAQKIADSLGCFLPTKKIVDDIYSSASIKLEPIPMFAARDSSITMYHHHLMIEGLRKQQKGLIAGIKKDLVITERINLDGRPNRVAIYGWHKTDGRPIQPLYTGHVNWYVDYSHGARLVSRKIKVNGRWMDYLDILRDIELRALLCDETTGCIYSYSYQ